MNDDTFNMEVRKLLKKVGVTSQREIEQAVRSGLETGALTGNEAIKVEVTLRIEGLGVEHRIDGEIALE